MRNGPTPEGAPCEARREHKIGVVEESGAAPHVRTHQGASRRAELSAELERRRGRQHRLVIAAHVQACAARALLVDIVEADMGRVEIDHGLGVPAAIGEEIGGAEPPVDIADIVIGLSKRREAGEGDRPVGVVPALAAGDRRGQQQRSGIVFERHPAIEPVAVGLGANSVPIRRVEASAVVTKSEDRSARSSLMRKNGRRLRSGASVVGGNHRDPRGFTLRVPAQPLGICRSPLSQSGFDSLSSSLSRRSARPTGRMVACYRIACPVAIPHNYILYIAGYAPYLRKRGRFSHETDLRQQRSRQTPP